MSNEAYSRAAAREAKLWKPFLYSFPFTAEQTAERVIIYGLYSTAYNNQHAYLVDIETSDLLNIVNGYNAKMSELTAQEQMVIADIVTKRYLAGIDKLIHDQKMVTLSNKIAAEDEEWTAKIAALDADRAQLETLAARVTSETAKTSARITELETQIEIEGINLSQAEIEILEKEIQSGKIDLAILDAANAVLKIQLDTVNTGLELVNLDLQKARTKIDIQNINRDIARTDILEGNLAVEQAQTAAEEAGLAVYETNAQIADKKLEMTENDVDLYESLVAHEANSRAARIALMTAEKSRKLAAIDDRIDNALFNASLKKDAVNFDATTVANSDALQDALDRDRMSIIAEERTDAFLRNQSVLEIARMMATANITTNLTHTIQKASE